MKLPKKITSNWYYINRTPIALLSLILIVLLGVVEILLNLINLL
jgi:hypothetical protein